MAGPADVAKNTDDAEHHANVHKQPKAVEGMALGENVLQGISSVGLLCGLCYVASLLLVAIGLVGTAATFGNGLRDGQYVVLRPALLDGDSQGIFNKYRLVERDYERWDVDIGSVDFGQVDLAEGHAEASAYAGVDAGVEVPFELNGVIANSTSTGNLSVATLGSAFKTGTGVTTNEGDVYAYADGEIAEFENFQGKLAVMVIAFLVLKGFAASDFLQKITEFLLDRLKKQGLEDWQRDPMSKYVEAFKIWRVKDLIISSQFMGPLGCAAIGGLIDLCQGLACSWLPNVYIFPLSSIKPDDNFINLASFDFDDDRLFYICAGFAYFVIVAITLAAFDKCVSVYQRGSAEEGTKGLSFADYHLETGGCCLERCLQEGHKERSQKSQSRVSPLLALRLLLCMFRSSLLVCLAAVAAFFVYYLQLGFKMALAFDFSLYGTLSVRYNLVAWACVLRFLLPFVVLVDFFLLCGKAVYALYHVAGFLVANLPCCGNEFSGKTENGKPSTAGAGVAGRV